MTHRFLMFNTLVFLVAACGGAEKDKTIPLPPVAIASVEVRDVVEQIEATGELLARDHAAIAAEVSGRVTAIEVYEGTAVEAEQVVIQIDPERRQLDLDRANARLEEAKAALRRDSREYKRSRALKRQDYAARSKLDEAEAGFLSAKARLAAAEADAGAAERALADATVKAPFKGLVGDRKVSVGEFVQVGQALFDLVALDPIEVEFHLTERDSSRVQMGQTVQVRVAPFPDETFPAMVSFIAPTIDPRTRTLRAKAAIDNSDHRLRPGLFARADVGVAERYGVRFVPEQAVLQRADGSILFRLAEDLSVERLVVKLGTQRDGKIEILDGVERGDEVIVRGHTVLADGSRVSVRNEDGTPRLPAVASGSPSQEGSE